MSTGSLRGEPYMSERTDDNYISLEDAAKARNSTEMDKAERRSSGTSNWTALEV